MVENIDKTIQIIAWNKSFCLFAQFAIDNTCPNNIKYDTTEVESNNCAVK